MRITRRRSARQRRAIALIVCYFCVALLLAFGSAVLAYTLNEQAIARRQVRLLSAFQMAEAGVDRAVTELKAAAGWSGINYTALSAGGGYDVTVTSLSPTLKQIVSTGHYPSNNTAAFGYQTRKVEVVLSVQTTKYDHALFAARTVHLNSNARVDSYDSSAGAYGGSNVSADGDVGSNATTAATISLESNSTIKGDAAVGPGGNPATAISVNRTATITGARGTLLAPKDLTPQAFPSGTAGGPLYVTADQSLAGGTYRYTYVKLESNTAVLVTGNVTLYVEQYMELDSNTTFVTTCGTCTITIYVNGANYQDAPPALTMSSNSLLSANAKPSQLKLVVTGTGASVRSVNIMDSNTKLYGTIDAPNSAITIDSNAHLYGAAIGNSFELNSNAGVHYDTALKSSSSGGSGNVVQQSWRTRQG
ncbi:MAG: hypothetical protein HYZ92_06170 [Candidatus Omnitrophica bacterium]|nr:hypothetical protein [Candidatus Omnitrophota bacterium]